MTAAAPFAGRTALVTGAGRGIGRALAGQLAGLGARVVVTARSKAQLEGTAEMVGDAGTVVLPADLSTTDGVAAVLDGLPSGGIDILVNNAATVAPLGPYGTVDLAAYRAQFDLNVFAVVALSFALAPAMAERGWGRILDVSSGVVGHPAGMIGGNAYVATKAALEGHAVNLAAELDGTGVTVNVYRPGTVDTEMQGWIRDQDPDRIGHALHARFIDYRNSGALITPEASAGYVLPLLQGDDTGRVWSYGA